nr:hypothetical protein [Sphingomonas gellani]
MALATPASAQFFLKSRDLSDRPTKGAEAGIVQPLPGATAAEERAGLAWTLRAALNVAALQCQFEPTLVTVDNYNATLKDHGPELKSSFDTLTKYFARTAKTPKAGQAALDQFGTRTYSSVTAVYSQINFCQTASSIGSEAVFTPRGDFGNLAERRMRELRNSIATPWGEQMFSRYIGRDPYPVAIPRLDAICWDKKYRWQEKQCGPQTLQPISQPVAGGIAAR